jgi:polar amino acid transport system substrate-binding protein
VLLTVLALSACSLPRDPNQTARHVENRVLRVGVSENPPSVAFAGARPMGVEPELVREFATQQHAKIEWVRNGETPLLEALDHDQLDLAIGGFDSGTPWAEKLGATRPFAEAHGKKHIWLTAAGENQFLLRLDRFLAAHKDEASTRLAQEAAE